MLQKNQLYTVEIEPGYTSEGLGVCRVGGQAVFVHGGVRGDRCVIRILKASSKVAWAKIEELTEPSPYRTEPDCAVYPACGGCDCRHMTYEEELYFKRMRLEQTLARISGVSLAAEEVIPSPGRNRYRNKALLPVTRVDGRAATGFFRSGSRQIIPNTCCMSAMTQTDVCASATRAFLDQTGVSAYDPSSGSGLVRHLFVRATANGTQTALVINGKALPDSREWVERIRGNCCDVKSILTIENLRRDNVVLGDGPVAKLWGDETLTETLGGLDFDIHPLAFAQVNSAQAVRLYDRVLMYASLVGDDTAADLYCGTGTMTLWLARGHKRVVGVELSPWSAECARRNAARNGIENAEFHVGDAGDVLASLNSFKPGVIVVDPPRAGLDINTVEAVAAASPRGVVYVSCDPGTLARDVGRFAESGFRAERLTIVDMFPGTRHVETVVLLSKLK